MSPATCSPHPDVPGFCAVHAFPLDGDRCVLGPPPEPEPVPGITALTRQQISHDMIRCDWLLSRHVADVHDAEVPIVLPSGEGSSSHERTKGASEPDMVEVIPTAPARLKDRVWRVCMQCGRQVDALRVEELHPRLRDHETRCISSEHECRRWRLPR